MASDPQSAFSTLQCAAGRLMAELAALLKPHGISPTQYETLRVLLGVGDEGMACGEIGRHLIHRDADMTRLLDRMERAGLIERCRSENDRRVVRARITAAGASLLKETEGPVTALYRRQFAALGRDRTRDLVRLLNLFLQPEHLSSRGK